VHDRKSIEIDYKSIDHSRKSIESVQQYHEGGLRFSIREGREP
jgi:hypothetical protein